MKYAYKLIFIFAFVFEMEGQIEVLHFTNKVAKSSVTHFLKMNPRISLTSTVDLVMAPQFGGLFDKSYQQVHGIANFKKFYNNFDFSCLLGFNYCILRKLIITSVYNVGLIKFEKQKDIAVASDAVIKISLCYRF